jgi:signal recognition particle subunit SRP72
MEDSKSAAQVLDEAVDRLYNLDRSKSKHSHALAYLIKQNIIYQGKQSNGKRVTEMLEILHKLYPNDTNTLSKLIVHYLKSDPERANLLAQKLPSIKQLAAGIDADTIESTFGKRIPKVEKTVEKTKVGGAGATSASAAATSAAKQKKKRKRKIRLPKKYDPSSKPDPERWLPLRERSYYRGKRGKRGKQAAVGKGTQGAVGSDQSATTTITTSTGAQRSMPTSKTTAAGSASTQPKPTPPPGKSAGGKRKGKR